MKTKPMNRIKVKMRFQIMICLYMVLINENYGKDVRIIGGENAEIEEYPFMASFRYAIQNQIFCGGAIISNKHILTTAHCLYDRRHEINKIRIYTGITRTIAINGGVHEILHVFYYPKFTGAKTKQAVYRHDIAVVEVKKKINFNVRQNLVALPNKKLISHETGFVMGWGSPSFPIIMIPDQLRKMDMKVISQYECSNRLLFKIHPEQFCGFKSSDTGTCYGDSGSPLVIANQIVGIVSVNFPCAQGIPDIYTRVYSYLDFIRSIIGT